MTPSFYILPTIGVTPISLETTTEKTPLANIDFIRAFKHLTKDYSFANSLKDNQNTGYLSVWTESARFQDTFCAEVFKNVKNAA